MATSFLISPEFLRIFAPDPTELAWEAAEIEQAELQLAQNNSAASQFSLPAFYPAALRQRLAGLQ